MAHRMILAATGMIAAAAPSLAAMPATPAPVEGPDGRYCLRVEPVTGSLVETIQCWTRAEWALQEVDVDREWAKEGVAVLK